MLGLLGGTAAAFAVTERLKLVPSPIVAPQVTAAFSPVCACETRTAEISFDLRDPDRVSVTIVDANDDAVAEIADDEAHAAGRVTFTWPGIGALEGVYRARVHLADARRTIRIPNPIRLDTTPPALDVQSVLPEVFSPDGDGRADKVRVSYAVSERASVRLLVDGERAVETPPRDGAAKLDWYGRGLRPGLFELSLVARDAAGNESRPVRVPSVRLRFVTLTPERAIVPAGVRFGVRVSTDAERYTWRLGARRGASSAQLLVLRAPTQAGRYTLRVSYGDYEAAAAIFVRPRP